MTVYFILIPVGDNALTVRGPAGLVLKQASKVTSSGRTAICYESRVDVWHEVVTYV